MKIAITLSVTVVSIQGSFRGPRPLLRYSLATISTFTALKNPH